MEIVGQCQKTRLTRHCSGQAAECGVGHQTNDEILALVTFAGHGQNRLEFPRKSTERVRK